MRLSQSSRSTVPIDDQLGAVAELLDQCLAIMIEKRELLEAEGGGSSPATAVACLDFELEDRMWEAMENCYQQEKRMMQ